MHRVPALDQPGRRMPGGAICHRCRALVPAAQLVEMVRPGRQRGVKWCTACVEGSRTGAPPEV